MAALSYTPTNPGLSTINATSGSADADQYNTKRAANGTLSAAAVVLDLRGCNGIPLVKYAAGVTLLVSLNPSIPFDSASHDWTAMAAGDGFADCPPYIAFQGTGAWELYVAS